MEVHAGIVFIVTVFAVCGKTLSDPCNATEYTEINEPRRSVRYEYREPEAPLCDIFLPNRWYRFVSEAGGTMPESCVEVNQCGTQMPIWLNGTHPRVEEGTVSRRACVNTPDTGSTHRCCEYVTTISVKNCSGAYYVYRLQAVPTCPMAYCAGTRQPCPPGQIGYEGNCTDIYPSITTAPELLGPEIVGSTFYFTCAINFGIYNNAVYEVKWTVDGEEIEGTSSIITNNPINPQLEGLQLQGHLNKNVGCSVKSYFATTPNITSPWFVSNTYWAGVRTEPIRIEINEEIEEETVYIVATIPKVCSATIPDEFCAIGFEVNMHVDVSVKETCRNIIYRNDWNDSNNEAKIPIKVKARRDHMRSGDRIVLLEFQKVQDNGVFNNLIIPPIRIGVTDQDGRTCESTGDPHIKGMEYTQSQYYNLYRIGDYILYENKERQFEVQTRTIPCNQVSCNCAVAIREYNDIIIIDSCATFSFGSQQFSPVIRTPRELSQATKVVRSPDMKVTVVYLPSSTEVKVTLAASLDVNILIPSTDKFYGRGLCGTYDGVSNNEFEYRNFARIDSTCEHQDNIHGMGCVPEGFTESWRIDNDAENLFRTTPPLIDDTRPKAYCICTNQTVVCSARGDISAEILKCTGEDCPRIFEQTSTDYKRSIDPVDVDENYSTYDPNMFRDFQPRTNLTWPTPSGITEQKAEEMCRSAIESSQLWPLCQTQNISRNIDVESCKIDILVSDSDVFVSSYVNAFLTSCQVEVMTNPDNNVKTETGDIVLKTEFAAVQQVCSSDCFLNGHCVQGHCVCNENRTGSSCQLKEGLGPQLGDNPGSRVCDVNIRPCRKIFLNATNFEASSNLTCKVQEILPDGHASPFPYLQNAEAISNQKLACYLPDSRVPSEISAKTFAVKASNDGVLYGNEFRVTVFDSTCLSCNGSECTKLPDTCLIHNVCYQDGDLNPRDSSQICNTFQNTTEWSPTPTIPSDYPLMTDPTLAFDSGAGVYTCTVHSTDTKSTARYKVSWIIDGELIPNTRELNIPANQNQAVFQSSQLPSSGMLACKIRSYYSDRNIYSPYFTSNVEDLSTRGV